MNDDMQSCEIGINENEDDTQSIPRCVWRVLLDLMRNIYLRLEIGPTSTTTLQYQALTKPPLCTECSYSTEFMI